MSVWATTATAAVVNPTANMTKPVTGDQLSLRCYPPGPVCPHCLAPEAEWRPISGRGIILSWVVFHRQYFAAYPPPHNCIAVRLEEGVVIVSTLEGEAPQGSWIGNAVRLSYRRDDAGAVLPVFRLAGGNQREEMTANGA
jgi:DUF35 OB-fold domain, acyl-CoA-associated